VYVAAAIPRTSIRQTALRSYPNASVGSSTWSRCAIVLPLACLLIPRGADLQLGSIMIDCSRLTVAAFAVMAAQRVVSGASRTRFGLPDVLMLVHVGLVAFSSIYHAGFGDGLECAIATTIDMGLAYFVARVAIAEVRDYHFFLRAALALAAISGVFGIIECLTGISPIRAVFHPFFPKVRDTYLHGERLGLFRASSTFRVDILFGLFCMMCAGLIVTMSPKRLNLRPSIYYALLGLTLLGLFSSLSSGPWLAMIMTLGLFAYDRILRKEKRRWKLMFAGLGVGFIVLALFSNRGPFRLIIDYLSLNPMSGYVRLAMYDAVMALAPDNWLIGWGWEADWPRPEWYKWTSIDCFYAVTFVRSGLFALAAILAFFVTTWWRMGRIPERAEAPLAEARAWVFTTVALAIAIITVDIFGNLVFWTFFLWGAGQCLLPQAPSHTQRRTGLRTASRPRTTNSTPPQQPARPFR